MAFEFRQATLENGLTVIAETDPGAHTADAAAIVHRLDRVVAVEERDVTELVDAPPDVELHEGSARAVDRQGLGIGECARPGQLMAADAGVAPRQIAVVDHHRAGGGELVENSRKQFAEDVASRVERFSGSMASRYRSSRAGSNRCAHASP